MLDSLKFLFIFIFLSGNNLMAQEYFIENKGQWNTDVLYRTNYMGTDVFICKDKVVYSLVDGKALAAFHQKGKVLPDSIKHHSIYANYLACNTNIGFEGYDEQSDFSNYYIGSSDKWASNVRHFKRVKIFNLYKGIDIEFFYSKGKLKYNFVLADYKQLDRIKIKYSGHKSIKLKNETLVIGTSLGELIENAPISFDYSNKPISTSYQFSNNTLSFKFNEKPSLIFRKKSVVVDPELVFSTYSGSVADNFGYTATYDDLGNGYAGGSVFAFGYPITTGAFQTVFRGGNVDIAISKYNPEGTARVYATYIGGSGEDHPHSMVVNSNNELIVMGSSSSTNFPTTAGTLDNTLNNGGNNAFDIVLFKFNALGTSLEASTFIGGTGDDGLNGNNSTGDPTGKLINNYADNFRGEVIIDTSDNIYIASSSKSSNFPAVNAMQNSLNGTQNAVILKINSELTSLYWSTYWGTDESSGYGLALGLDNELFVVGGITAANATTFSSAYQPDFQGGRFDGYILNLNSTNGLGTASYLGTSGDDQAYLVQTDNIGRPYAFGQTTGGWPETSNTYQNSGSGQFIVRLARDLSTYDKSMVFGSGTKPANISPSAFLVDECDRIFISGWGGTTNASFPGVRFNGGNTRNMPLTEDALQKSTDGSDFYLAVFSKNLEELLYGTYFGGTSANNQEHVDGGTSRFDKRGVIYQSVCASCNSGNSGFPTSIDAWSRTNNGLRPGSSSPGCNNALFKIDFESFNRKPQARDSIFSVIATENLNFSFEAKDPDKYDSLFIRITSDFDTFSVLNEKPTIAIVNDIAKSTIFFNWTPSCKYVSKDTYTIQAGVYDQGCPTLDSNFAEIKVVVLPPPLAPNPDIICITFDENNIPEITWEEFSTSKYSRNVRLIRKNPNGSFNELKRFSTPQAGSYQEGFGPNFAIEDYCYFFISENICGMLDTSSARACTVKEFSNPIPGEKIVLVTVESDTFIRVYWNRSDENDFGGYRIYRKTDGIENDEFKAVGYIDIQNDTSFLDNSVKVDDYSYCYYVIVEDDCGNKSLPQDISCSILLEGDEFPFYFTLNSNPYIHWDADVKDYELWSKVDTGSLRFKQQRPKPTNRVNALDKDLDYDWGGYYYQYRANNITNDTTPARQSWSNTIYLIQPPLLHVPSAFSPNGDGHNDDWGIVDVFVKTYQILVFNRWGEKVYDSKDKNAQWNATYKGEDQNDNVYIWLAYYTGWDERKYSQKGNVTVIK